MRFTNFIQSYLCSTTLALIAYTGGIYTEIYAAEENNDEAAAESIRATKEAKTSGQAGELKVSEFAKTGLVGSSVGITTDPSGKVYVSNTNRRNNAAVDIRKNPFLLIDTLGSTSVDDKRALIRGRMTTWEKLQNFKEQIICVVDTDGDGKADKSFNAFEGLGTDINGVAAGVLWFDNALYVTCIPTLYKLTDPDGDGVYDQQQELVSGFGIHVGYGGHDMHGPTLGMDGRIYWSIGDKGYRVKNGKDDWFGPGMGAVFRIEPDGTGFEVFCNGLRNPQELAFDQFGNLFTADHDGDFGDKEGLRFLVQDEDAGWRAFYQYRNGKKWGVSSDYNPWMIHDLWMPPKPEQPAYVTPPFEQLPAGPIGFEWEPGTALNDRYRGYFFLAYSTKNIAAFKLVPKGAGFAWEDHHNVLSGPFSTGLYFGADGGLYAADWGDNAWAPHMNGRVLKLDDPNNTQAATRLETKKLLQSDFNAAPLEKLATLLGHADQRIRLQAQIALTNKGNHNQGIIGEAPFSSAGDAKPFVGTNTFSGRDTLLQSAKSGPLLARIHALWGLGTLARRGDKQSAHILPQFLSDSQAEIRTQAAKMIGEAADTETLPDTAERLGTLLADPEPRPRLMAGVALARLGQPQQFSAAVQLLLDTDNKDIYLRHAGVMALVGCSRSDRSLLSKLHTHPSRSVRLAAIVALRRAKDASIATFLNDADQTVAFEAALAIHDDLSIPAALPALAALLDKDGITHEALLWRAISANLRIGDAAAAKRLALFATKSSAPEQARAEAVTSLEAFLEKQPLDRVQGFPRHLPARNRDMVIAATTPTLEALLFGNSKPVQAASAKLIAALKLPEWQERLVTLAKDDSKDASTRITAFNALEAMGYKDLASLINKALSDKQSLVRSAALGIQLRMKPNDDATYKAIDAALASELLTDRQQAILALGSSNAKKASTALENLVTQWKNNKLPQDVWLEVYEAVQQQKNKKLIKEVTTLQKNSGKKSPVGEHIISLIGGDPIAGENTFRTNSLASCMQCHIIGSGGLVTVGPNLSGVGTRLKPEQLLLSMVNPGAEIADGFGIINVTLQDGSVLSGALAKETDSEIHLRPIGGVPQPVAKNKIASQSKPVSIMPPMAANLTPRELRDLVAYLLSLK